MSCPACTKFYSKYKHNSGGECDCPRCQGLCTCAAEAEKEKAKTTLKVCLTERIVEKLDEFAPGHEVFDELYEHLEVEMTADEKSDVAVKAMRAACRTVLGQKTEE